MKPFTHALALGLTTGFLPRAVVSGFFVVPTLTVLRTIASTPDCGGAEEKRFSLTQGERLREGSAPSDKQGLGLISKSKEMLRHCTGQIPALINKAAEHNKGRTPLWITCGLALDHRYRPMSIIIVLCSPCIA